MRTVTQPVDTPCLEWDKALNDRGYGVRRITHPGGAARNYYVHRLAMAEAFGWDAIKGRIVMHSCDNPKCYRVDHLVIGTHKDNSQDMLEKGRSRGQQITHCPQGHEYTTANTNWHYRGDGRRFRMCQACVTTRRAGLRRLSQTSSQPEKRYSANMLPSGLTAQAQAQDTHAKAGCDPRVSVEAPGSTAHHTKHSDHPMQLSLLDAHASTPSTHRTYAQDQRMP